MFVIAVEVIGLWWLWCYSWVCIFLGI